MSEEEHTPAHTEEIVATAGDANKVAYPREPELVIGLVAPIGTPLKVFHPILLRELQRRGYDVVSKKLSKFTHALEPHLNVAAMPPFDRYNKLMTLGNTLRTMTDRDDVLSLYTASDISNERPAEDPRYFLRTAFVVNQLKRPEEVFALRRIYGEHFLLMGLYCPKAIRRAHLEAMQMSETEAQELIARDEDEARPHGQRVSDTFHLSDVFIEVRGDPTDHTERTRICDALARFLDLLFGTKLITPTRDEYGEFIAYAASLRSSSLARQVGAALLTDNAEVLGTGTNDVPCFPGGLYWGDEIDDAGKSRDARDHILGYDESDLMKRRMVEEVLPLLIDGWADMKESDQLAKLGETLAKLKGTRITSLTEFARAVHAEMEAIASAARVGMSVRGAELFSTTFPCHVCAKHIVAAGIKRVVYIEPYPKSRALDMYGDSIYVAGESPPGGEDQKVLFTPFLGVAPRRFADLFGRANFEGRRLEYKDKEGHLIVGRVDLRIPFSPLSYVDREALAARDLEKLKGAIHASASPPTPSPKPG